MATTDAHGLAHPMMTCPLSLPPGVLLDLIRQYPLIRSYADRIYGCQPLLDGQGAIVGPCDEEDYENQWMYRTIEEAVTALMAWDGEGEPQGWTRHMPSGRR
ncbi:MAG: hypothetical protein ACREXW_01195 [Gammaproteobacteria bacterium]